MVAILSLLNKNLSKSKQQRQRKNKTLKGINTQHKLFIHG